MIGAAAGHLDIGGGRHAAGLGPFLKRGFGIARVFFDRINPFAPQTQDQRFGLGKPAVHIDGRNHRLHRVAQQRHFAAATRETFGSAQLQRLAKFILARDVGAGFFAHQGIKARGQLAFGCLVVLVQKRFGHHKAKNAVAQKFQPLVVFAVGAGHGRMDQGPLQQLDLLEFIADAALKRAYFGRAFHWIALKKRSPRHVQKNSIELPADENMTRSARPTRFSNGTKPTPFAMVGTRLSDELSRLSPIKK